MLEEKPDTGDNVYFKSLNGLRGLAAIFILLFHSMFPLFGALWIGVPVFFVLSGFLITRILLQHKTAKNYLKVFYFRRALRIFPIYYLALLISILWGLLVHADLRQLPVFLAYLQNFTISNNVLPDYCNGIMNHTWSLSAEELFYLVWPLFVLIFSRKAIFFVSIIGGMLCIFYKIILLSFFYTSNTSQLLLLSLAGNLDGLMAGTVLGILSLNKDSFLYKAFPFKQFFIASLIFVVAFSINYFDFPDSKHIAVCKAILSVSSILFSFYLIASLISSGNQHSIITKLLNASFMQFSGKISYGIYLYHALVFGITASCIYHFRLSINPVLLFLFEICITYFAAILSWHYIERPLLKLKNKLDYVHQL